MIAWKPMVVYGGPNYPHRPWGPPKPRPWGKSYSGPWGKPQNRLLKKILKKNNPVAWGPPQLKNFETSDAPDMSDYLDDYEQGNLLTLKDARGVKMNHWSGECLTMSDRTLTFPTPLLSQLQGGCQKIQKNFYK